MLSVAACAGAGVVRAACGVSHLKAVGELDDSVAVGAAYDGVDEADDAEVLRLVERGVPAKLRVRGEIGGCKKPRRWRGREGRGAASKEGAQMLKAYWQ